MVLFLSLLPAIERVLMFLPLKSFFLARSTASFANAEPPSAATSATTATSIAGDGRPGRNLFSIPHLLRGTRRRRLTDVPDGKGELGAGQVRQVAAVGVDDQSDRLVTTA